MIVLLLFVHGGAIIILLFLPFHISLVILLIGLCLGSGFVTISKHDLRLNPFAVTKLWQEADGNWQLQDRRGQLFTAKLRKDSICTTCLVLLNFQVLNRRFFVTSVVIPRDALAHDNFRRLRVHLLTHKDQL